jgi:hypothetical protein
MSVRIAPFFSVITGPNVQFGKPLVLIASVSGEKNDMPPRLAAALFLSLMLPLNEKLIGFLPLASVPEPLAEKVPFARTRHSTVTPLLPSSMVCPTFGAPSA